MTENSGPLPYYMKGKDTPGRRVNGPFMQGIGSGLERYTLPESGWLWGLETQLETWRMVEIAAVKAQGRCSAAALELLEAAPAPSQRRVNDVERRTRHDVVAFLEAWRACIGEWAKLNGKWALMEEAERERVVDEASRAVHWGMTSSDLVDTANAVRWREAGLLLGREMNGLVSALAKRSLATWSVARVGRTHGQWAERMRMGQWWAERMCAAERVARRVERATAAVAVVKMSGPVGDYKRVTPEQERRMADELNRMLGVSPADATRLVPGPATTQVVSRDGLAELMGAAEQVALLCASVATEIRLASQSERGEMGEWFGGGQRGSSSMPQKRNPIVSEQTIGLTRLMTVNANAVKEGMVLWGERDISHSSVERVAVPIVMGLGQWVTRKVRWLTETAVVDAGRAEELAEEAAKATSAGAALSWLVERGVATDAAWELVAQATGDRSRPLMAAVYGAVRKRLREDPEGSLRTLSAVDWSRVELGDGPGELEELRGVVERLAE